MTELPEVELRVIEYAPGKWAPVAQRDGEWTFTGGRVYRDEAAATEAIPTEANNLRSFWGGQLADRSRAAVVDGRHHRIGTRPAGPQSHLNGFGGRLYRLRDLATGDVVETNDLWWQGVIPDSYRPFLPDTHEILGGGS